MICCAIVMDRSILSFFLFVWNFTIFIRWFKFIEVEDFHQNPYQIWPKKRLQFNDDNHVLLFFSLLVVVVAIRSCRWLAANLFFSRINYDFFIDQNRRPRINNTHTVKRTNKKSQRNSLNHPKMERVEFKHYCHHFKCYFFFFHSFQTHTRTVWLCLLLCDFSAITHINKNNFWSLLVAFNDDKLVSSFRLFVLLLFKVF